MSVRTVHLQLGRVCPRAAAVGLSLFWGINVGGAAAQTGDEGDERLRCVAVSVSPDHWASGALRRLQGIGATAEYLPYQRTPDLCEVHGLLTDAIEAADASGAAFLAADLKVRLEREFPGLARMAAPGGGVSALHLSIEGRLTDRRGAAAPGIGEFEPHRTGAIPLTDGSNAGIAATVGLVASPRVAVQARPFIDEDGAGLEALEGVLGIGPLAVTIGRGEVGFGTAEGGAIVLRRGRVDRVQIATRNALRLPARLGRLGFTTFLTRMREDRHPGSPYFWGASASLQPHWRTTFSVHRAALIRADDEFPLTARSVAYLLMGRVVGGGLEDQVVSVEGRFHLPTEGLLPLTVYLEWGAEDAAGAWRNVPARILGVEVPVTPGAPGLSFGAERTHYAPRCCGNPGWYRHWSFPGSWASRDEPLGHPLGGNGVEWRVFAGLDRGSALRIDGAMFRRDRGPENLYSPGRDGVSWGGGGALLWRIGRGPEIFGRLGMEYGNGWRERRGSIGGRIAIGR